MIQINDIQHRLKEVLSNTEKTQTEIAQKLQVSQSAISHFKKGDIMPSLDTFANLCAVLDVDPAYILCLTDEY